MAIRSEPGAGPNSFSSTLQNAALANAQSINTGLYTFTVTDFYACVEDSAKTYTVNQAAIANAGPDQSSCGQACERDASYFWR